MKHTIENYRELYKITADLPSGHIWEYKDCLDLDIPLEWPPAGTIAITIEGDIKLVGHINVSTGECACCCKEITWITKVESISEALELCKQKVNIHIQDLD